MKNNENNNNYQKGDEFFTRKKELNVCKHEKIKAQKLKKLNLTTNQLAILKQANKKIFLDEIELSEIEKIDENIDKSFENDLGNIGIKPKNDIKNAKTEKITSKTNCKII